MLQEHFFSSCSPSYHSHAQITVQYVSVCHILYSSLTLREKGKVDNSIPNHFSFTSWCLIISDVRWNILAQQETVWTQPFNKTPAVCLFLTPFLPSLSSLCLALTIFFLALFVVLDSFYLRSVIGYMSRGGSPEVSFLLVPVASSQQKVTEIAPYFRW